MAEEPFDFGTKEEKPLQPFTKAEYIAMAIIGLVIVALLVIVWPS